MTEHVYDALAGVLFSDWPKNAAGQPVVYDRPIKIWNLGDRVIKGVDVPSLTFQGETSAPEEVASGTWEVEHAVKIEINFQGTSTESSDRGTQEMSRILFEFLKERRRLWVLTPCPICLKLSLSPEHFLVAHADIFQPYADAVVSDFASEWSLTHASPPPTAELTISRRAGLATEAFYRVFEAVRAGTTVANLPSTALSAIQVAIAVRLRPVRLLYQGKLSGTASEGSANKQLLAPGKWSWKAKEIYHQSAYGPDDNTPTGAAFGSLT